MADRIPYGRQSVDESDIEAVAEILRGDFLTTGPAVQRFEESLAGMTGAGHAVAVNSGTSAIHAMYFAAGIGEGDEIVTSPLTFAATANAALYLGASVRFADVQDDTGTIDVACAEAAMTERTRAIVAIDYAGHPADYDALQGVARRRGVVVLADAAHSLGATYRDQKVGTLALASALSFHPVKPITTAEGGAVVTSDDGLAARAARFRTHGVTRDRDLMLADPGPWFYEMHDLGFNYRLTDVQAALGTSQLHRLGRFLDRRRAIAGRYHEALADIETLRLPTMTSDVESGWHLYVIRTRDTLRRRPLFDWLIAQGLGVQVHYIPVYQHPYYQRLGYRPGLCPVAERFYEGAISIPIFPGMSDPDVDRVIDILHRAARELL